jgi:hypothetical protein
MTLRRTRSVDEYVDWVPQAVLGSMNDGPSVARKGSAIEQRFPWGG